MAPINKLLLTFLLNSLWEITLIFAVTQIGLWVMRRSPARFHYRGWIAATVMATFLPMASILGHIQPLSLPFSGAATSHHDWWFRGHNIVSPTSLSLSLSWMYPLVWCYFVFLIYRLFQFAWAWSKTKELRDSAYSPELSRSALSILETCRSALRIKTVSIRCSSLVRGPLTIGTWAPQILLPAEILATLSQDEWMSVLSHEMAHVYRKDFVKNFAFELLCTPISYHPLVLLMKSRVASAREMACDELATARCIEPQRYMRSLLTMAGRMSHLQCADSLNYGVGIFDGQMLEERIMKLLNKNRISVSWSWVCLGLLLVALVISGTFASAYSVAIQQEIATKSSQTDELAGQDSRIARVGPGITAPRPISTPDPQYPKAGRDAKREGNVQLWCVIGTDGMVHDIRVTKSLGRDFDESSITAVRKWKFKPAIKAGEPIAVQVNVETTFRLYK